MSVGSETKLCEGGTDVELEEEKVLKSRGEDKSVVNRRWTRLEKERLGRWEGDVLGSGWEEEEDEDDEEEDEDDEDEDEDDEEEERYEEERDSSVRISLMRAFKREA